MQGFLWYMLIILTGIFLYVILLPEGHMMLVIVQIYVLWQYKYFYVTISGIIRRAWSHLMHHELA